MIKVAIIGAGSIGFTRKTVTDILSVPEFRDSVEFAFHDISKRNLDMVYKLCKRDMEANGVKSRIRATLNCREALKDANYIFCVVRVGGLEAFRSDIEIPLKYGVDQCVGDTLCAGGIMYAQRTIPAMLDFCNDAAEVAAPDCLFISHVNPMSMNTWACSTYSPGVRFVGLCHGVEAGAYHLARVLGVEQKELDFLCAGINHQTWFISAKVKGKEMTPYLLKAFEKDPLLCETEKVRIDMLRRFGYYCTESNGHAGEYVAWYRKRPGEVRKWIDLRSWILGETGGYLRNCTESRNWFETDFPNWMKETPPRYEPASRSAEHGSYIMEGQETGRTYRGYFNVMNDSCITNLPTDACIEVPGYVDRNGLSIPRVGELPLGCAAVCNASISVQRLAVEAAVFGDDQLLRQAMMMDPLVGAVCTPPEIWQMVDELLVAQSRWLPQYKTAAAAAKRRLKKGPVVKTRPVKGTRLKPKSVAEMAKAKAKLHKLADATDKRRPRKTEQNTKKK